MLEVSRQRVGILIVAYNAATTLTHVLHRIPAQVWAEVDEVLVLDDASQDATYEAGIAYKTASGNSKLNIFKNPQNLGYGGNQKAGYRYFMENGLTELCCCMATDNTRLNCSPKCTPPLFMAK